MKNGVPFDIAMDLDDVSRFAWCVIFREFDGDEFDEGLMRFIERKP